MKSFKALLFLGILIFPLKSFGAISYHGTSEYSSDYTTASSISWFYNISAVENPIIFTTATSRSTNNEVTSVTWNTNENFTKIGEVKLSGNGDWVSLWYIIPVAIGNYNITVNLSGSYITTGGSVVYSGASSVQDSILTDKEVVLETTSSDLATIVTPSYSDSWIVSSALITTQNGLGAIADDSGASSVLRMDKFGNTLGILDSNSAQSSSYNFHTLVSGGTDPKKQGVIATAFKSSSSTSSTSSLSGVPSESKEMFNSYLQLFLSLAIITGFSYAIYKFIK